MEKVYKTIRLSRECKYWINELIFIKECELTNEKKSELIFQYENLLRNNPDFEGYSPTLSISVSCGGVLEAAYKYTQKNQIDWNIIFKQMEKEKNTIEKGIDVGTLTPRFYMYSDIFNGLEEYRISLKSPDMQRKLMLSYVIKAVIYSYYKNCRKKLDK